MDMLEGQELNMIAKAWNAAGRPQPTADANQQLGEPSAVAGTLELQAAMGALNSAAVTTLLSLRDAATGWKNLVGAGRPYDFKLDPGTMGNPKSANCPGADCGRTITLYPGSPGVNCFEKDFPGNVLCACRRIRRVQRECVAARIAVGAVAAERGAALGPAG